MVVYDKNNIRNMYLSPYLKFAWDETGVTVYQIVFCRALRIEAKREMCIRDRRNCYWRKNVVVIF